MQKALHPEGDAVCHIIVLHPPGGIAGGDELELRVHVGGNAHGLLATPGAGKWYRSAGARARQRVCFTLESDACLEWLPQETIVFDGALAAMTTAIHLADRARYIGWEITCLGRTGSGERFTHGTARMQTRIDGPRGPVFIERGELAGGAALLESAAGLGANRSSARCSRRRKPSIKVS